MSHGWLLVLGLVGLDYFSTLAYLPSLAVKVAGPMAPWMALGVVLATWCLALPVYSYLVGRSRRGLGAAGLAARTMRGWRGKVLMLVLVGFLAADFVVTRSLSVADASAHLVHNTYARNALDRWVPEAHVVRDWLGPWLWSWVEPYWTPQLWLAMALSTLSFGFWFILHSGFTRRVLWLAATVVAVYLLLSALILASGLVHAARHPDVLASWWARARESVASGGTGRGVWLPTLLWMTLRTFPQLVLGLSGFELCLTVAPFVAGNGPNQGASPATRVRHARSLMRLAASLMTVYLLLSVLATAWFIPDRALAASGTAEHRALAYLAHAGELRGASPLQPLNPWFGAAFGTLFDISSVAILCLAGATITMSLKGLMPQFLHHLGMELNWAHRTSAIMHLFNAIILTVTVVFRASVAELQAAYATSVCTLLAGAAFVVTLDFRLRTRHERRPGWRFHASCSLFFLTMACMTVWINRAGLGIALLFVGAVLVTSFVSRWLRSTELRCEGFDFADDTSAARWRELRQTPGQILVPHRPGRFSLGKKNREVRALHRLQDQRHVTFVEVEIGDPSEFFQRPRLQFAVVEGLSVLRVSRAVSAAHVLGAIALELCTSEHVPELVFGWSRQTPLAANLDFLLWGEGNVPWLVRELVRKAERNPARRPRILMG